MTEAELLAYAKALGITDSQYAGMTVTSAAQFLSACAEAEATALQAETQAMEKYLLQLQIEGARVHIAIDRAIAAEKNYALNVPATPPMAA